MLVCAAWSGRNAYTYCRLCSSRTSPKPLPEPSSLCQHAAGRSAVHNHVHAASCSFWPSDTPRGYHVKQPQCAARRVGRVSALLGLMTSSNLISCSTPRVTTTRPSRRAAACRLNPFISFIGCAGRVPMRLVVLDANELPQAVILVSIIVQKFHGSRRFIIFHTQFSPTLTFPLPPCCLFHHK